MHSSAVAHIGVSRHIRAWPQQLAPRQSSHALPPTGQVGGPQTPPLHCPSQHCEGSVQEEPFCSHWAEQMPAEQVLEQQSENATQVPPLGVHMGGPQVPSPPSPPEQSWAQH